MIGGRESEERKQIDTTFLCACPSPRSAGIKSSLFDTRGLADYLLYRFNLRWLHELREWELGGEVGGEFSLMTERVAVPRSFWILAAQSCAGEFLVPSQILIQLSFVSLSLSNHASPQLDLFRSI